MIDLGRKRDMEMLMAAVNNPYEPLARRRRAYRTVQSIKRKMGDKTILKLRLRLIAASMSADVQEVERIGERITAYERRYHLNRKY